MPAYASPPVQVILSPHNNPGMLPATPPRGNNYLPIPRQEQRVLLQGSSKEQRNLFLRNVFGILSGQAMVITGLIGLLFYIPDFRSGIVAKGFFTFWSYWVVGALGTCATTLLYKLMRKPPVNLVLLSMITFLWGGLLGTLSARLQRYVENLN
jgi:FtsH-binding integral membrane protein